MGFLDGPQLSLDLDESAIATGSQLSSSPPNTGRMSPTQPSTPASLQESLELQVDYWPFRPIGDGKDKSQSKSQDQSKNSVKSSFKNFHVSCCETTEFVAFDFLVIIIINIHTFPSRLPGFHFTLNRLTFTTR